MKKYKIILSAEIQFDINADNMDDAYEDAYMKFCNNISDHVDVKYCEEV